MTQLPFKEVKLLESMMLLAELQPVQPMVVYLMNI